MAGAGAAARSSEWQVAPRPQPQPPPRTPRATPRPRCAGRGSLASGRLCARPTPAAVSAAATITRQPCMQAPAPAAATHRLGIHGLLLVTPAAWRAVTAAHSATRPMHMVGRMARRQRGPRRALLARSGSRCCLGAELYKLLAKCSDRDRSKLYFTTAQGSIPSRFFQSSQHNTFICYTDVMT